VKFTPRNPAPEFGRREFLSGLALAMASAKFAVAQAGGQAPEAPSSAGPASPELIDDLVTANHILAQEGVVDGYGHVSVRHTRDANRYLIARYLAPELVTAQDIMELDLDSRPVIPGQRTYSEIFIHGEIYKARPDVKAIVHNHAPSIIPFGVTGVPLRPLYHMSSFIGLGVPVFDLRKAMGEDTDMLIRNAARGRALAQALGNHPAVLLRGHGAVVVAAAVPRVVARSIYLQINATLQLQAMAMSSEVNYLNSEETLRVEKDVWDENGFLKAWELWKKKAQQTK